MKEQKDEIAATIGDASCAPIQRPTAPSVFRWYLVRLRVVCVRACVGVMWVRFVDTPWASIDIRSARGERALP